MTKYKKFLSEAERLNFIYLHHKGEKIEIPFIYIFADNAKYYYYKKIKEFLKNSKVQLYNLPPYSQNLNIIERLWKFFQKIVLYNKYYKIFRN